jgi:hypothetical protein
MSNRVLKICLAYESGFGHGLQADGLTIAKASYNDAAEGEAYQIGYDAGLAEFHTWNKTPRHMEATHVN